jgi:peptide/nickel transport system permease protein
MVGVTLITFTIVHLVPGSPVRDLQLRSMALSDAEVLRIERTLGLNKPVYEQYLSWLGQLVRGDLGISMINARPVLTQIWERFPNTLLLTGSAMVISLTIAIPVGLIAAVKRNSAFDHVSNVVATLGFALPTFWIGLLLILLFSVQATTWGLPALPSSGMRSVVGDTGVEDRLRHLILPVLTLSMVQFSGWIRYVRSQVVETLAQDYVRTARSKGLAERAILFGHAFRNAMLPLVTLIGLSLPEFAAGAVVVETIFSWPGIGSLSTAAARNHDYTLIMGMTVFIALFVLISNLLTDIIYAVVDPRITYR